MDFIAGKLERTSIHIHCHLKRYPTHNILTRLAPGTPGRSSRANHDRTCNNVQINYISLRYVPNIYEIKHSGPSTTTLGYCASQHVRANSDTMHQEVWGGIRRFGVAVNAQAKTPPAPPVRDPPLAQIVGYPDALDARFSIDPMHPIFANGFDLKNCDEYPFASTVQGGGMELGGMEITQLCVSDLERDLQGRLVDIFYRDNCGGDEQSFMVRVENVGNVNCDDYDITPLVKLP